MNTNTPHCADCRHGDQPLPDAEKAMVRLISLTLHPRMVNQMSVLMDVYDAMAVAAYVLYSEHVDFAGTSLIEQFERAFIDTFEDWTACARFITEFVYRRGTWIGKCEQKTGRSFADLLATGDETVRRHLHGHGLLVIDTGENIAVFHRRSLQ